MNKQSKNQEQQNVNNKGFEEILSIEPSGYHKDRALNCIYGIKDNVIQKSSTMGIMPSTDSFVEFVKVFVEKNPPPAGGWYLVKEQRDWLKKHLVDIVKSKYETEGKTKFDILEAGIASFNHHFSYLKILTDALLEINIPEIVFQVTVTDKAFFPIFCIESINAFTFPKIAKKKQLNVFNQEIPLSDAFIEFLNETNILSHPNISVRTKQYDLTDTYNVFQLGKFDIITEHFITAVINNFQIVKHIRKCYAELLRPQGYLLDASGISPHIHEEIFDQFLDFHEEYGLESKPGRVNVWDPYGMRVEDLKRVLNGEQIEAPCDNGLFVFQKTN